MDRDRLKVFCGSANPALAREICACLGIPLAQSLVSRFSDGEVRVQVLENVRGADVFVVQPTCQPVDTSLMELLLMMDALKRASARRITPVVPYYGYSRQDRKDRPRVPISAKLVADLLMAAGADRALTMDLHAPQIQGFFAVPVDYLLAIVDKRRVDVNVSEVMHVIGDVEGRTAVVVDDIIDTAGTLVKTTEALLAQGATAVYACCTHPVLSGEAVNRICQSRITQVV